MRNLAFTSQWKAALPSPPSDSVNTSRRSYCFGRHGEVFIIEQNEDTSGNLITSKLNSIDFGDGNSDRKEERVLHDCPSSWITQVQQNADTEGIYFAVESGQFFMLDRSQELSELFSSEEGIAAFSVSPDGRFVAVVTSRRSLLLMSIPYVECLAQHNHHQSKDTKGTGVSSLTQKDVTIAWRSDSKYFAVNIITDSDKRCIAVYDEDGSFVSKTEESVTLLNAALTWQPSGGLFAAFGFSPTSKNAVFLFEKNGLQRAEFSIGWKNGEQNANEDAVEGLEWNLESTILAVTYANRVELWTRSNYVWMLKRTVKYFRPDVADTPIRTASWDCQRGSRLHVIYDVDGSSTYSRYDVDFTYTTGTYGPTLTLWWNGRSLCYTPFRDFCAPPPSGYGQVTLGSTICSVVTYFDSVCVIDSQSNFSVYNYSAKSEFSVSSVFKAVGFSVDPTVEWLWRSPSILLSVTPGSPSVFVYSLNSKDNTATIVGEINLEAYAASEALSPIPTFRRIFLVPDSRCFVIGELSDASLVLIQLPSEECIERVGLSDKNTFILSLCNFPHSFTSLQVIRLRLDHIEENPLYIIIAHDALSKNLYVQWNRQSLSNPPFKLSFDCTSACVFDNHLLFTTTGSLQIYKGERLVSILEKSVLGNDDVVAVDTEKYLRKIEKGSNIVTCCVNRMLEPSLVLQIIPRGNLEVIFPRPLLIASFSKSLRKVEDEQRYSKIMTAIRRHRVDYRVLIDEMKVLAKEQTSSSLEAQLKLMINQVQDSHSLVLLVTDLNEEYFECTRLIKDILKTIILETTGGNERKRNLEEAYLASLAKLGLLEEALNSHLIKGEKDKERRGFVTERVKFLSYYCDNQDILFDTAIGTYDLTLASLVADCLGKDPKEYVPILDGFQNLSEHTRMFKIDERLRRFSKAIVHLINDDSVQVDEVLRYVDRHRLFTDAIEYITKTLLPSEAEENKNRERLEVLLKECKGLFGKYLEEHNRAKEASLMFRQGGQLPKAIDCAVKSGSWESALEIFYSSGGDKSAADSLCNRIILQLEELKNYGAAAVVAEEHLQDPSRAVELHMRNRRWLSARLCAQRNEKLRESKCVEETILPKLEEFAQEHLQVLESLRVDLKAKRDRLKIAKALKKKRLDDGVGDFDNFSDTSSISTTSSIRSGSSGSASSGKTQRSKNKRKMERKLQSMKEGSAFEDLAITAFLWNSIEKVEGEVKRETSELVESLWTFELESYARSIGTEMDSLVSEINSGVKEVWETVLTDELLEVKFRVPPPNWTSSWDKLSLHESSSKATSSSKHPT